MASIHGSHNCEQITGLSGGMPAYWYMTTETSMRPLRPVIGLHEPLSGCHLRGTGGGNGAPAALGEVGTEICNFCTPDK